MSLRRPRVFVFVFLLLCGGIFAYIYRGEMREWWFDLNRPTLPLATRFSSRAEGKNLGSDQTSPVEGGVATSEHFVLITSPQASKPRSIDPFADLGPLPQAANLAVPFTSQAPFGDWNLPYQETCEEASAIMVDGYYRGETGKIAPEVAKQKIGELVAFEKKFLGFYEDTSAQDTARFIKAFYRYPDVVIRPLRHAEEIKRAVANGYPVIVPTAGKLLPNPFFRGGGPLYHMLVVKGYTKDRFITNDPGTRRGADFSYTFAELLHAAHDWNGGDVIHGSSVMLVVIPRPSL